MENIHTRSMFYAALIMKNGDTHYPTWSWESQLGKPGPDVLVAPGANAQTRIQSLETAFNVTLSLGLSPLPKTCCTPSCSTLLTGWLLNLANLLDFLLYCWEWLQNQFVGWRWGISYCRPSRWQKEIDLKQCSTTEWKKPHFEKRTPNFRAKHGPSNWLGQCWQRTSNVSRALDKNLFYQACAILTITFATAHTLPSLCNSPGPCGPKRLK